jgi:Putative lumazine-binding
MKKGLSRAVAFVMLLGLVASVSGPASAVRQQNSSAPAKPAADTDAIKQTALDYIEGWYEGNAERMERALHPELAKRIVRTDPKSGRSRLDQMSAMSLVQGTRGGYGKNTPKEKQQKDVTILDVFEGAASVKVVAGDWIDYLHMARFNGRWVIVNVLWELKPETK